MCDLGFAPPSNGYLSIDQLNQPEIYYPLQIMICDKCWLMQIVGGDYSINIFNNNYRYFSSFSQSWLQHAEKFVSMISSKLKLHSKSKVMEIASNDGYLLQYFVKLGIPCFGVDPAEGPRLLAAERGVDTENLFFGKESALLLREKRGLQDLIIGNNVLAHIPLINDFIEGLEIILSPNGTITLEFPHLLELLKNNQFDTIYHEHYSYLSLKTVQGILHEHNLIIYDVEQYPTHGGSLRVYICHIKNTHYKIREDAINNIIRLEEDYGIFNLDVYMNFQEKINQIKRDFISFLIKQKNEGKLIIGYGAAAKGNTLLNFCGIKGNDLIECVIDSSPYKQGLFLPGSHIPILGPDYFSQKHPDYVVVFPWNIIEEISENLAFIKKWGGTCVKFIPNFFCINQESS